MVSFGEFFFFITLILKNTIFFKLILWSVFAYIERVNHVLVFFVTHLILYMYFFKKWKDLITL